MELQTWAEQVDNKQVALLCPARQNLAWGCADLTEELWSMAGPAHGCARAAGQAPQAFPRIFPNLQKTDVGTSDVPHVM